MTKKLKLLTLSASAVTIPALVVACSSETKSEKVVFQLAQNLWYPLLDPIKDLAKIYNQQQKGTQDFLEVVVQDADDLKIKADEQLLINQVAQQLETLKNQPDSSYENIPSMILNSLEGAFVINQYNRLLDLTGTPINKELFDETLYEVHNKLPGNTTGKTYTIPFDVTSLTGLTFNLDIMKLIFDQIEAGGGTVDKNSEIYKKTENADKEGRKEIPENKAWRYMVAKSTTAFTGYTVNDATFSSLQQMMEFAKKVFDGLKLDESKMSEDQKAAIFADSNPDPKVFSTDYTGVIFEQFLYDYLGVNQGTEIVGDVDKFLWKLSQDAANSKNYITYLFREASKKPELEKKLQEAFDAFVKNNSKILLNNSASTLNPKAFKSIYFNNNGNLQWGAWDVRDYNSAFALAPHVGIKQSYITTYSMEKNAGGVKSKYETFAKPQDIFWSNQVMKMQTNSTRKVFNEGGSSLIAINTTEKRNKATVKFINWLLQGAFKDNDGKDVFAKDYLLENSSYVVPTKDRITFGQYQSIKTKYESYKSQLATMHAKANKTENEEKAIHDLEHKKALLEGALLSLEDILEMKGMNLQDGAIDANKRITLKFIPIDDLTSKVMNTIRSALAETTKTKSQDGSIKTGQGVIDAINKIN
ncbi:P68 family surface lipoprotein [Candidatus Mycoplasma pogonae]